MESDGTFSLLFDEIFYEPRTNHWVNSLKEVRNLRSREFDILRLEDLCDNEGEGRIIFVDRPASGMHLEADVLVMMKNPSGMFEDLVHVFLSQLLEVHDSWLEFVVHISLILAESE